jgi:hypothetical protein
MPEWAVEDADVVIVVTAPGYRTVVMTVPFVWDSNQATCPLVRDSGRVWTIRGRVSREGGEAARDLGLVVSPASLKGIQYPVLTDSEGRFELRLDEADAPLFFEGEWGGAHIVPVLTQEQDAEGTRYRLGFGPDVADALVHLPPDASGPVDCVLTLSRRVISR